MTLEEKLREEREEGQEEGRKEGKRELLKKMLEKGNLTLLQIAKNSGISMDELKKILE